MNGFFRALLLAARASGALLRRHEPTSSKGASPSSLLQYGSGFPGPTPSSFLLKPASSSTVVSSGIAIPTFKYEVSFFTRIDDMPSVSISIFVIASTVAMPTIQYDNGMYTPAQYDQGVYTPRYDTPLVASSSALLQYASGLPGPSPSSVRPMPNAASSTNSLQTIWGDIPIHAPGPHVSSSTVYSNNTSAGHLSYTSAMCPKPSNLGKPTRTLSPTQSLLSLDWRKSSAVYTKLTWLEEPLGGRTTLILTTPPGRSVPVSPSSARAPPSLTLYIPAYSSQGSPLGQESSTPVVSQSTQPSETIESSPGVVIVPVTTLSMTLGEPILPRATGDASVTTSTLTLKTTIVTSPLPSFVIEASRTRTSATLAESTRTLANSVKSPKKPGTTRKPSITPSHDSKGTVFTSVLSVDGRWPYPYPKCSNLKTTLVTKTKTEKSTTPIEDKDSDVL